jgi:hypothetical protein
MQDFLILQALKNVLIGADAGRSQQDVDGNVAIGYASMYFNTNGDNNVAVGRASLANMNFVSATTSYNTASRVRMQVMQSQLAYRNTLIGGLAGDALTEAVEIQY